MLHSRHIKKQLSKLKNIANAACTTSKIFKSKFHGVSDDWEEDRGPLDGVRVCDMTRVLAGPYCTQILGDMGAEVIKVERPGVGDDTRHWGPPFVGGESCYYLSINRNKKSVSVDLTKPEGKDLIYDLVKRSDVFVENFTPNKMNSMGFGYDVLKEINPRIVYCSISGFGARGPDRKKPGYDLVASGIGGLMSITGPEDGDPCVVGVSITDIMTGMYAHGAILAALYERVSSGVGKKIDASLLQSQVAFLSHIAANYLNVGHVGKRHGTAHGTIVPYQAFNTGDEHDIVVAAANNKHFQNMCKAIGLTQLATDRRYLTNPKRVVNRETLIKTIQAKLSEAPSKYWLDILHDAGVPCGRVNTIGEVFDDPQVYDLDMVLKIPHPTAGQVVVPGPAVDYNGTSILVPPLHPPLRGEHTVEVLEDILEYGKNKIQKLLEIGIIEDGTDLKLK